MQNRNAEGIAGASIRVLNTNLNTVADGQGKFLITNVPAGNYTVQVTALGYAAATQTVQ